MSKKKIIAIVSVLAILLVSVSVISYSIANRGKSQSSQIDTKLTQRGEGLQSTGYTTNIDLIIQASNKTPDGEYYNIVEIVPNGTNHSALKDYISNGHFKEYVIDENSATEPKGTMADDKIHYDVITVNAATTLDDMMLSEIMGNSNATIREILDETDLIYMSSPSYYSYGGQTSNDGVMSEDIYNYLHTYTLGKNKPMILDYVTPNGGGGTAGSQKYKDLVEVISNNHIRFKTFAWKKDTEAKPFFRRDTTQGSYYVKYDLEQMDANGKVLVISNNANAADTMWSKMTPGGDLIDIAYFGTGKPEEWVPITRAPGDLTVADLEEDYDFILLENDIMETTVSDEIYQKLKMLSESGRYIFYDDRTTKNTDSGTTTIPASNNYLKLMEALVTNKGLARYSYILPVSYGFFNSLNSAGASGIAGAKNIADIINAGDYRGSGTNGSNGKVFRVLELQPCYPIDLKLAETENDIQTFATKFGLKGNYYTTSSVLTPGVTKDEIEEGTEYYDFDLSRAKIAYATGLAYNQVQVDQMSTNELISKKDVILETYDLVYIGGNASALLPADNLGILGDTITADVAAEARKVLSSFCMYTHTGILSKLNVTAPYGGAMSGEAVSSRGQSTDAVTGQIYINGQKQPTVAEYNGNDINSIKYNEIKEYVNKGMPVIVDARVTEAFQKCKDLEGKRIEQLALKDIDPDSWMYKTLDAIYAAKDGSNVYWGMDSENGEEEDEDGNASREYGNTLGASLTVFKKEINEKISNLMNVSAIRPNLTVVSSPKEYSEGNKNSYNSVDDGFKISAYAKPATDAGSKEFTLSLYIDLDGNGVFSEGSIDTTGECAQTLNYTYSVDGDDPNVTPNLETLNYNLDEDFYGIVSWKVVAKDVNTGLVSSVTGYAYYERKEKADKKKIEILQILPRLESTKREAEAAIAGNKAMQSPGTTNVTLMLCTECQMYRYRAEYNLWSNASGLNGTEATISHNVGNTAVGTQNMVQGVSMGLHDHKFGIVKFNSATQEEDWDSNLADVLIGKDGDYDVDLDIVYSDEFEDIVATVQKQSKEEMAANKILMNEKLEALEAAEQDQAYLDAEQDVKDYLISLQGNGNYVMNQHFKEYADAGEYYKFWFYNINGMNVDTTGATFRALYNKYISYRDKVVKLKKEYRYYRRLAYAADQWLANNYSIVVLGWAEEFGGADLNQDACDMIKDYIARGGSMLNTHDSTTRYAKAGAMNITENLRASFGMDRFHVTGVADGGNGSGTAGAQELSATIKVPSYEYTKPVEKEQDATYSVYMICPGNNNDNNGNDVNLGSFTIKAGEPQNVKVTSYLNNGTYWAGWKALARQSEITLNGSSSTTVTVNAQYEETKYDSYGHSYPERQNVPDGVRVYVKNPDGAQVATGVISSGTVTLSIPQYTIITEKAKSTREFSDSETIVIKDSDKSYSITLVDSTDYSKNGSIRAGVVGTTYDDLTKQLTVTVQLQFPECDKEVLKELLTSNPIAVSMVYNSRVYTRSSDANGLVTFTLPQIASLDMNNLSGDALRYRHFITEGGEDGLNPYFFTERAITDNYVQWNYDIATNSSGYQGSWNGWGYNSPIGVTDSFLFYDTGMYPNPYRYVQYQSTQANAWDFEYEPSTHPYGPNGASQVNKGIVTTYPFLISSELRIAQTHSQTYALDMEDKDVAVWYTLGAGYGRNDPSYQAQKLASSFYAASPHDGMNNYYLYSKGNIFYCGSGHSPVTGPKKDNNDERRLFINVIVNSVRNANQKPKITVHRKDTNGAEVKEDKNEKLNVDKAGNYTYAVDSTDEVPEFDFKVKVDTKADLAEVYVFYDLDYGLLDEEKNINMSNAYAQDANHVLIAQYNTTDEESKGLKSNVLAKLRELKEDVEDGDSDGYKNLKLKPEYFAPYGGYYTYIVIQATDSNDQTSYQRIKINLIPKLWDLTLAEPDTSKVLVDATDRVKYNI